jgi:HPt (histidine-containing phosphotransfer) domain-containing protein
MSVDYWEINYEDAIDDYDEEIVNTAISSFVMTIYQELKTIIPEAYAKKNYQEIKARLHKFKTTSRYIGAINFSGLCNKIQSCCEKGKIDVDALAQLYEIFINNIDKLYNTAKKIYDTIVKKKDDNDEKEKEKETNEVNNEEKKNVENNNEINNIEKVDDNNKLTFKQIEKQINIQTQHKKNFSQSNLSDFVALTQNDKSELVINYEEACEKFSKPKVNEVIINFIDEKISKIKEDIKNFKENPNNYNYKNQIFRIIEIIKEVCKKVNAEQFSKKINSFGNLLSSTERFKKINKIMEELSKAVDSLENEFLNIMKTKMKINRSETNVKKYGENIEEKEVKKSSFVVPKISVNNVLIDNINQDKENIKEKETSSRINEENLKKQINTNAKLRGLDTINYKKFVSVVKGIKTNQEGLFTIENDSLDLEQNDKTPFKAIDNDISKYYSKFKNAIDSKDRNELIQVINQFKDDIVVKYNFPKLFTLCDKWKNEILKEEDFDGLNANYNDIQKILNIMKYQYNSKYSSFKKNGSENYFAQNENILSSYMKNDDNILGELRPFKISFLKEYNSNEEFEKKIKKLLNCENKNENIQTNQMKTIKLKHNKNLSKRFHNIRNSFVDRNPFNQKNYPKCTIY